MKNIDVTITTNINNNIINGNSQNDGNLPGGEEILVPGRGYILNPENGLYLMDMGGEVVQENFMDGDERQMWAFQLMDGFQYSILNISTFNVISLQSESSENGIPLVSIGDVGSTTQAWRVRTRLENINGQLALYRQFVNIFSSKAMDNPQGSTQPGTQMIQYSAKIGAWTNQIFRIIPLPN